MDIDEVDSGLGYQRTRDNMDIERIQGSMEILTKTWELEYYQIASDLV